MDDHIKSIYRDTYFDRFAPPGVLVDHHDNILLVQGDVNVFFNSYNLINSRVYDVIYEDLESIISENISKARLKKEEIIAKRTFSSAENLIEVELVFLPILNERDNLLMIVFQNSKILPTKLAATEANYGRQSVQDIPNTFEKTNCTWQDLRNNSAVVDLDNDSNQFVEDELSDLMQKLGNLNLELSHFDHEINHLLIQNEVAIVILNHRLNFVRSSSAFQKIIDFDIKQDSIQNFNDYLIGFDLEQQVKKVIENQASCKVEVKSIKQQYLVIRLFPLKGLNEDFVLIIFNDITDKKLREESIDEQRLNREALLDTKTKALEANQKFLEITNEVAKVGGWELDYNSNKVFWTRNTYKIHDVPEGQEITLEFALSFFPDNSRSIIEEKINLTILKGEKYDVELPFENSKGEKLWVRAIGFPVFEAGKCNRLYGTFQDISEREKSKQKLIEAEERYHSAFNTTPDAIIISKVDGSIVEVNQSFEKIIGYTSEEVIGKTSIDLGIWANSEDRLKMVTNLRANNLVNNLECNFLRKNGSQLHVSLSATFIQLQGETFILSIVRDITEQKETEKKLSEHQARFEAIFNHSENAILIADDQGNYASANNGAANLLGFNQDVLEKMNVSDLATLMENSTTHGYNTFVRHGSEKGEFIYNHPDGKKRAVMYSAVRIGDNLNFSILSDITDRKNNEDKLKENFDFIVNLTNNAPGTLFQCTIDLNQENLHWNYLSAASKNMFGLNYENLKTNPDLLFDLIIPEDRGDFLSALNLTFTDLTFITHEYRIKVQKKLKWIIFRANPIKLKDGSVTLYGYLQDITERKQSRLEIQRSENIFRTITELSPAGITILDEDKNISFVNKSIEKISGYQASELMNLKIKGIDPIYQKDAFKNLDDLVKGKIDVMDAELKMFHRSGNSIWVRVLGTRFPALAGQNKEAVLLITQDITEQKSVEVRLKARTEQLQNITNSIPGLVLQYQLFPDGSDKLLFISEGVEVIFEVNHQEAIVNNKLLWDRIHPEDLENYKVSIEKSARELSFWDIEHRVLLPGGEIKWINGRAWPKKMEDGSVIWDTLLLDITNRKNIQNDLIQSERLANAIADSMPGLIYVYDLDESRNVWSNFNHTQMFNEQLQYDSSQGLNFEDISSMVHPDDFQEVIEYTNKLKQDPGLTDLKVETRIKDKDEWCWMNLHIAPFLIEKNGQLKQLIGALFDINERKKMESALVESEEKYRFIIEKTSDLIALIDRDVNVDVLSQNLTHYTGYSNEEFKQLGFAQNVHPDEKNLVNTTLKKLFQNKSDEEVIDYRFKTKSDKYIWLRTRAKSIKNDEGQLIFILVSASDITDQKLYEQQLIEAKERAENIKEELHTQNERFIRQNDELKKTNHELDNFVYRVSHDLRAPITSALGLTQLNLMSNDLEEIHLHHQLQMKSLQKLDNFIKDILNFTRNSRLEVVPKTVDFDKLVEFALAENAAMIDENHVKVQKDIVSSPMFRSDVFRLQIVLNNLISNAIKYQIPEADDSYVKILIEASEKVAVIKVEDNGIGIDVSHYDKIFNMFYRATDRAPGSGLGLYIVRDSLSRINGSITFNSDVGKGTTFEVTINSMIS